MPYMTEILALLQVLLIDLSMAGDNALVVGMAAAGLPADKRHKAVLAGIGGATVLRIVFAVFAVQLLHITGLLAAGGLLLLWVSWKMFMELRHVSLMRHKNNEAPRPLAGGVGLENTGAHFASPPSIPPASEGEVKEKKLSSAIWQIIAADVSMSLDNVLGVAGVARDHIGIMVVGLTLSVVLMGVASSFVARLAARFHWIGYLGLVVILFTAVKMVWDGAQPFLS